MHSRMFIKRSLLNLFRLSLLIPTVTAKGTAPHDVDCSGAPDGLHEIGCWGYANCLDGKPVINECGTDLVFDMASMTCVKPGSTNTDCFLPVDCSAKPDASYPDYTDSCVTYYRCFGGKNLGRFYCPAQTAFNEDLQICDYPQNIPAPCGSKFGPTAPVTTPKPMSTTQTTSMPTQTTPTTTQTTPTTTQTTPTTTQTTPTTTQTTMTSTQTTPTISQTTMTTTQKTSTMTSPSTQTTTTAKVMQTSQLSLILSSTSSCKPTTSVLNVPLVG